MDYTDESVSLSDTLVRRPLLAVWLAFAILLAIYHTIYSAYFPIDHIRIGDDYSFFFPALLDGIYWHKVNDFAVQWFTPAFLAGQPAFPDSQHINYSLPQALAIAFNPLFAVYTTLLISASLLFWGGALLMRKVFNSGWTAALLVGGLLMLNDFLPYRMIIGHLTHHGFALIPWIALLLLIPIEKRCNANTAAILAGVLMAYLVYAGTAAGLALPSAFTLLYLLLFGLIRGSQIRELTLRLSLATITALALAASKIVATLSFMRNVPRDDYPLPGTDGIVTTIKVFLSGLFLPGDTTWSIGKEHMLNQQWALVPVAWAYGFGLITAILAGILLIKHLLQAKLAARSSAMAVVASISPPVGIPIPLLYLHP